jgi:glycosyltransferase involved in cell wall biosynthesis
MVALERWTFRTADVSVATNESYRQIAIERGGMDPDRVFVVRSGPTCGACDHAAGPELKHGRRYLVGYVGVMGKQEGIDLLLQAVRTSCATSDATTFTSGWWAAARSSSALQACSRADLGVEDYVTFTGRVPDQELLEMLNTAEVCVNPDVANEMNDKSTMNKIMEYMALGKPIVQFDLTEGRVSAQARRCMPQKTT